VRSSRFTSGLAASASPAGVRLHAPDSSTTRPASRSLTALAFGSQSRKTARVLAQRFPRELRAFAVLPPDSPTAGLDASSVIDHEGHAHRDYGIDGDTLLVVRPDGYVGMRVTDPDQVHALDYLRRVLPQKDQSAVDRVTN
jgi:hypothetical protein